MVLVYLGTQPIVVQSDHFVLKRPKQLDRVKTSTIPPSWFIDLSDTLGIVAQLPLPYYELL